MTRPVFKAGTFSAAIVAALLGVCLSWARVTPAPGVTPQKPPSVPSAASKPPSAESAPAGPAIEKIVVPSVPGPNGRRDPFRTLIQEKKAASHELVNYPPGKKGLVIEQLDLRGTARAVDGEWIAVVDNKSKRAYFLHAKDQLYNGVVAKVMPDRVVFEESFNEPLGKTGSREIVKKLTAE